MKILTPDQMREVDRRTIELGIPGQVLMENAGHRVVEFMAETFAPLGAHRIVVFCGKGNNGGDGFVVARQLHTLIRPQSLHVVLACSADELQGDAQASYRMLRACGCPVATEVASEMRGATLVVDALLGTGLKGPAAGKTAELIRDINSGFPQAKVVAVDIPSGLASDQAELDGDAVRADYTVTFTAPKVGQMLPPNCARVGRLRVAPIGSPSSLYEDDPSIFLSLVEAAWFREMVRPRPPASHKGDFGHVLVIGGARGKTGAAAMAGTAALRAGAGLATVASAESAISLVAAHAPELMTSQLPETEGGAITLRNLDDGRLAELLAGKDVVALGPGIGTHAETVAFARRAVEECRAPMVVDADGLNALAGWDRPFGPALRVLTPHPGEMARLCAKTAAEVQADRVGIARAFAVERKAILVLKGYRTLLAFPDGQVWVNPTGSPAMATGGAGDILTGLIAGFLAQFPAAAERAVAAAVYLHGLAGEIGAAEIGEKALLATDLLRYLPQAYARISDSH